MSDLILPVCYCTAHDSDHVHLPAAVTDDTVRCCPGCNAVFGIREAHTCVTHSFGGGDAVLAAGEG